MTDHVEQNRHASTTAFAKASGPGEPEPDQVAAVLRERMYGGGWDGQYTHTPEQHFREVLGTSPRRHREQFTV